MPALNQLKAKEAYEFLNEFVSRLFDAAVIVNGEKVEGEKIEALKKVKLIERQFPGMRIPMIKHVPEMPHPDKPIRVEAAIVAEPQQVKKLTGIDIKKIDSLLVEPDVDLIECSNGKINIRKNGKMQETGFVLSENEIEEIINKFAEKTNTPLKGNFLYASLSNIRIHAIISKLIGSRFLITIAG